MKFIKILPSKLNIGDTIGVVAPSNPIIGDNIEELNKAKEIVEKSGFKVKYSKILYNYYGFVQNQLHYSNFLGLYIHKKMSKTFLYLYPTSLPL